MNVPRLKTQALKCALASIGRTTPVVFPVHPRTKAQLTAHRIDVPPRTTLLEPQPSLTFALQAHARAVVTDSGGVQEKQDHLGVPCLTFRATTERPVTITVGTNRLVGDDPASLVPAVADVLNGGSAAGDRASMAISRRANNPCCLAEM